MINKVTIASFSMWEHNKRTSLNGMIEPLVSFFVQKCNTLELIDGIHPGCTNSDTIFESYSHSLHSKQTRSHIASFLKPFLQSKRSDKTQLSYKIRDFLTVFEHAYRYPKRTDIFIGLESIFTLAGICLKKLNKVKTIIYYVSDYSPNRYGNRMINAIYLALDRFCCIHADYVWDVSPAMMPARIKHGFDLNKSASHLIVPNGLFENQINPVSMKQKKLFDIVYAGSLTPENGPDILIKAIKIIVKTLPKIKLHFYGGPLDYEKKLKVLTNRLHLNSNIVFHGLQTDVSKLSNEIRFYSIGLAPYRKFENSVRWYADATKLRLYMGAGLPVITTEVPPLGKTLDKAGIIINDDENTFASTIISILSNRKTLTRMSESASKWAKNNTWEKSYSNALKLMKIR